MISDHIKHQIRLHALQFPQEEVCGFVMCSGEVFPAVNIAKDKTNHFIINPESYMDACERGEIEYIYHSHASQYDNFSEYDKISANHHSIKMILYCVPKDLFREYAAETYFENTYTKIKFELGKNDCITLVKKYYKNELGIEIVFGDLLVNLDSNWHMKNSQLPYEILKLNPDFQLIPYNWEKRGEFKKHDILLFNYYDEAQPPHHFGVYLQNETFLHHPRGKYSRISLLDKEYKDKICGVVRHKSI